MVLLVRTKAATRSRRGSSGAGEQINYWPQSSNLNQGAWYDMEELWAREIVAGRDVRVEIRAIFEGESKRPIRFDVGYTIDGQPFSRRFENE